MEDRENSTHLTDGIIHALTNTPNASDGFLIAGALPTIKAMRKLIAVGKEPLSPDSIQEAVSALLGPEETDLFRREKSFDLGLELKGNRFRVNCYYQKNSPAVCIRKLQSHIPPIDSLGFDMKRLGSLLSRRMGIILVTGPTGSGKSTTLASIIHHFNRTRNYHIITIEDPIEYLHDHNCSLVSQRELGRDTSRFAKGLRDALRESPDVIMVGELRDNQTVEVALQAAETGHLVLTTMHTLGAQQSIIRLVNSFPGELRDTIRTQLASCLSGVISQILVPTTEGKLRLVYEALEGSLPLANLIRSGQEHMILNEMVNSQHCPTINDQLDDLCLKLLITPQQAIMHSPDPRGLKVYR